MHILKRIARICKADIHAMMDQLEDKELLLKQYLRDMAVALEQKEVRQKKLNQSRHQAAQRLAHVNQDIEKIEQDLEVALFRDRDDIARLLIRRLRPLTGLRSDMQHFVGALDSEIAHFQESIDRQRHQYERLQQRVTVFFDQNEQSEWDMAPAGSVSASVSRKLSDEEARLELIRRKAAFIQNKGGPPQ